MNQTQSIALYQARRSTVARIGEHAASWPEFVRPILEKGIGSWFREQEATGRVADKRAALRSPAFSDPGLAGAIAARALARLRDLEGDVYEQETRNVADALNESTPDWLAVSPSFEEAEEAEARSAEMGEVPQEAVVTRAATAFLWEVQTGLVRAAREGTGWQGFHGALASASDGLFRDLYRISMAGGIWAANVAKEAANRSLSSSR